MAFNVNSFHLSLYKINETMNRILERISWKTRRWNFKYQSFILYLHNDTTWGFSIAVFTINNREYSMLSIQFRLPNKTNVKVLSLDHWDILFLRNYLFKRWDHLDDSYMWHKEGLTKWEIIQLRFLDKIFK